MGLKSLLTTTPKSRHNYKAVAVVGLVGGVLSAIVKLGWKVPLPPRTSERNATNSPQEFLEQLGMLPEASYTTMTLNGSELPICSFVIYLSFVVLFVFAHCLIAERYPKAKLWQGAVCGLTLWVLFHVALMPAMGIVPVPWDQPPEERSSEALGHVVWMWAIEIVRRDLRNGITRMSNLEVPLDTESAHNVKASGRACSFGEKKRQNEWEPVSCGLPLVCEGFL